MASLEFCSGPGTKVVTGYAYCKSKGNRENEAKQQYRLIIEHLQQYFDLKVRNICIVRYKKNIASSADKSITGFRTSHINGRYKVTTTACGNLDSILPKEPSNSPKE
jgi:hypothetical protein